MISKKLLNNMERGLRKPRVLLLAMSMGKLRFLSTVGLVAAVLILLGMNRERLNSSIKTADDFHLLASYKHPDANKLDKVASCSSDQMTMIKTQLGSRISEKTRCPNNSWLQDYFKQDFKSRTDNKSFIGISIGCNKGFDAINTARMGMNDPKFDKLLWVKEMTPNILQVGAKNILQVGACKQMLDPQFEILADEPKRSGEMHCVEPVPSTAHILHSVRERLGLDKGSSTFEVTKAAVSSADGTVAFPNVTAGVENANMGNCKHNCEEVPMYSLQSYVNKFVKNKIDPINVLSIDVEGFDFDVLFGAGSVLDRTEYIEFEYHKKGNWINYHIMDTVRLLNGKGFTCYWAGQQKLWRLTECDHELYEHWHGWSNVACVHRSQNVFATKMEKLFIDSLKV